METYTYLFRAAISLYLLGGILFVAFFLSQKRAAATFGFLAAGAGFCLHSACLIIRWVLLRYPPVSSLYESLCFFAWVIMLVYGVVELRQRNRVNGAFVLPLVALITGYTLLLNPRVRPLVPALKSPWLGIHAAACLLAYACFLLAFCFGVMYLWQEREVKTKKIDTYFFRLPSLGLVDRLGYKSVVFGFIFLSFGIVSGSIWAYSAWGSFWSWDPKETSALIVWLVYVLYLHGRLSSGWRGRKSAWLAVAGFATVLFTYLGVSFLLPGLHAYF